MDPKSMFQSKTIWANGIALAVALAQYYFGAIPAADPEQFTMAVTVINIALRFVTKGPVKAV